MEDKKNLTLTDINNEISRIEFMRDYGEYISPEENAEYEKLLKLRDEIKENT